MFFSMLCIDNLEEDYYINKTMPFYTYQKFSVKLIEQKMQILKSLETTQSGSLNLNEMFTKAVTLSSKLPVAWKSSDVNTKRNCKN